MCRYAPFARDATAGRLHLQLLFLSLAFSLFPARSPILVRLPSRPLFALFLSLRLIFFSLSSLLLFSPCLLSHSHALFFPSLSLSSPLPTPVQCGPHALASPARATQHTWPVGHSYLRSVRSYLLQGTASRGPQAATARSAQHGLCSLVSRAHDTSQRRTERPDRQIAFSLPGSACGAFSFPLSLSLSDSFSLSPSLPFCPSFLRHSLPAPILSSLPPFPSPLFLGCVHARDISRPGTTRVRPRVVSTI